MSDDSGRVQRSCLLAPPEILIDLDRMNSAEAKQLGGYVELIAQHFMSSAYGRQFLPDALGELTYGHPAIQALSSLTKDWDGYGSDAPSETVIGKANDIWNLSVGAFGRALPVPEITPGSSGMVAFTWKLNQPQRQLELWVHDNTSFSADWCLLHLDGSTIDGELKVLDDVIPILHQFLAP